MGFPRKLPLGYCLRLQLFLRWARQLAVDRGAPLALQDWWHVEMAEFDNYRIDSVRTRSPLPVPNPYSKAGGMHISSTPIKITMSRSTSLTIQPPTIPPDLLPSPPSPTAPIGNASFSSSSTAATPTETSVFVNGKWFVLLDDDLPVLVLHKMNKVSSQMTLLWLQWIAVLLPSWTMTTPPLDVQMAATVINLLENSSILWRIFTVQGELCSSTLVVLSKSKTSGHHGLSSLQRDTLPLTTWDLWMDLQQTPGMQDLRPLRHLTPSPVMIPGPT